VDVISPIKCVVYYEELDKCIEIPRIIAKSDICRLEAGTKYGGEDV